MIPRMIIGLLLDSKVTLEKKKKKVTLGSREWDIESGSRERLLCAKDRDRDTLRKLMRGIKIHL